MTFNLYRFTAGLLLILSQSAFAQYEVRIPYSNEVTSEPDSTIQWSDFADTKGLSYTDWNDINWYNAGLTEIPEAPYPVSSLTGSLNLSNNSIANISSLAAIESVERFLTLSGNGLSSISGLSNLKSVGVQLNLSSNNLTHVDPLMNLTSTGDLSLTTNKLTNVNGLINVTLVTGTLGLIQNQITDIRGIANIDAKKNIFIDSSYNGPKIPSSARFCQLNSPAQFYPGYAQKSTICE